MHGPSTIQQHIVVPHDNASKLPRIINEMICNGHIALLLVVNGPHICSDSNPRLVHSHVINCLLSFLVIIFLNILPKRKKKRIPYVTSSLDRTR